MNEQEELALLANVKSFTDHMKLVDEVFRQLKVGRNMTLGFQCGHSGLWFPGNYLKEWGRLYGIGLGPTPVSEVLDTDYFTAPPEITSAIRSFDQIMHPVGNCMSQVDAMLVDVEVLQTDAAILAAEDPYMEERARIIRAKQRLNPLSRLPILEARWAQKGGR